MTLVLPQSVTTIRDFCNRIKSLKVVTVRYKARPIGKLTALIQAIFPAPLHYRQLQSLKHKLVNQGGIQRGTSVEGSTSGCLEWPSHIHTPARPCYRNRCFETELRVICQDTRTRDFWSQNERLLHINCLGRLAEHLQSNASPRTGSACMFD